MLTILGIILFTLLWGFALSGLIDALGPMKKQMKKSAAGAAIRKTRRPLRQHPQF